MSVESLEFTLYCIQECRCDSCGDDLDLPPVESLRWKGNLTEWAREMSLAIATLGWTSRAWDRMRCFRCSSRAAAGTVAAARRELVSKRLKEQVTATRRGKSRKSKKSA